jgi:hypothetical protein
VAVKKVAIKKILVRVRLDEKAFTPMHETEINAAVDCAVVPWHPEILVSNLETVNLVVPQAIILREYNLHRMTARFQLAAQAIYNISETADFGNRRALRCYHHDVHFAALNLSATPSASKRAFLISQADYLAENVESKIRLAFPHLLSRHI